MAKINQWFPLFPGDYLRDTMGLSSCEHGCYLLLLMHSWSRGPLRDDLDYLQRIAGHPPMETVRFILESYWKRAEEGWINQKLEAIRDKQSAHRERLSNAGKRGMEKRWGSNNAAITELKPSYNQAITNQSQNQNQLKDNKASLCSENSDRVSTMPDGSWTTNRVPYSKITELWAEMLPELPQPLKLTPARKTQIKARWNDELPDLDAWRECFGHIRKSAFLMGKIDPPPGRNRFVCTLDWITKQSNLLKLYEGKYDA